MELPTNGTCNLLNNTKNSTHSMYFGVYTPSDNNLGSAINVFQDKAEALKLVRKNKKARFKAFMFYHEAAEFALNGAENPNNNTSSIDGPLFQLKSNESNQPPLAEKASPFKGPKPQELVELRKNIEVGNYKFVSNTIWQNPRYLVSSGDTPSILQEGSRLNALHVAAKAKNAPVTELVLNTITDPDFIKLLYGDDNQENAEDRCHMLLDLYLNTPNKGLNETPLHFAVKYGAVDVVEILVSYPQCNKTKKNKHGFTASQIICERAEGQNLTPIKKKIEMLLEDNFYVPVLRTQDNSLPPSIGEPFSPTSPPVLNKDPLSPQLEIHAYAGPMDKKVAQRFRKLWKTPPRSLNFNSPNGKKLSQDAVHIASLRFKDPQKGLERIGKKLANELDVSWKEYWPFLNSFVDISSEEGLQQLEAYLSNRYAKLNTSLEESLNKTEPIFSPISKLCSAFSACRLSDSSSFLNDSLDHKSEFDPIVAIDKACQVFANRISNNVLYLLCSEHDNIFKVLENEVKQLELLVNSYMDDKRFSCVNFQKVHSRLGALIGQKLYSNIREEAEAKFLCKKIEGVLEKVTKSVDCFSSDDESHNNAKEFLEQRKPTAYRKQLICLIHNVLNVFSQHFENKPNQNDEVNYVKSCWDNADACACVYHLRKTKKSSISRGNSFKSNSKFFSRSDAENISKRLSFGEGDNYSLGGNYEQNVHNDLNGSLLYLDYSSSSDEEFYTPPSSPSLIFDSDSEDDFNDAQLPKQEIYLEGDSPSKTDCAVFNALRYANSVLDVKKYPTVYRWHHNINLYTESERASWTSAALHNKDQTTNGYTESPNNSMSSSFTMEYVPKSSTPIKSWLRITGVNSPKALFKPNTDF